MSWSIFQTTCKLHSKEREVERLKAEIDHLTSPPLQEVMT